MNINIICINITNNNIININNLNLKKCNDRIISVINFTYFLSFVFVLTLLLAF